jgi:hypothetical protein
VIVVGHQDPLELYKKTDRKDDKGNPIEELMDVVVVPISVGRSGRMKLPAQFSHLLVASSVGTGSSQERRIHTQPSAGVTTKSPFFEAKPSYPIEDGLVRYFALRK